MPPVAQEMAQIDVFRRDLSKMHDQFKAALPPQITPEKFLRVLNTAVGGDPKLLQADRQSLWSSCMKSAQDGLLPDKREAALVIFGNEVVYMPMVGGILKKIRNSGELAKVDAHVVYEKDRFNHVLGDCESILHEPPAFAADRGKEIGAYAVAHLKDGTIIREVMSRAEIEVVRGVSRAKDSGPWKTWWGEMAKKTVIRRLSKRLPMSTDIEMIMHRDDDLYDLEAKPETPKPSATTSSRLSSIVRDSIPSETAPEPVVAEAEVVNHNNEALPI